MRGIRYESVTLKPARSLSHRIQHLVTPLVKHPLGVVKRMVRERLLLGDGPVGSTIRDRVLPKLQLHPTQPTPRRQTLPLTARPNRLPQRQTQPRNKRLPLAYPRTAHPRAAQNTPTKRRLGLVLIIITTPLRPLRLQPQPPLPKPIPKLQIRTVHPLRGDHPSPHQILSILIKGMVIHPLLLPVLVPPLMDTILMNLRIR